MMITHDVKVGDRIRVPWLEREGRVTTLQGDVALVELFSDNAEYWVRLSDLERAIPGVRRVSRVTS